MRIRAIVILLGALMLAGCSSLIDARGDSEICEIHHSYMRSVRYPGRAETDPPTREYLEARVRFFRHSYPMSLPRQGRTEYMIYLCDDCVQAEAEWLHLHGYPQR